METRAVLSSIVRRKLFVLTVYPDVGFFYFFYFIGIVWSNNVDIQKTNQRKTVTEFNWVIDWVFLTALVFRMQTEA